MDKALACWTGVMGVGPLFVERHVTGDDEEYIYKGRRCVQDVSVAHAYTGEMDIELAFCDGFAMGGTALEFIEASDEIRAKFGKLKSFCDAWDGSDPIRGKIGAASHGGMTGRA